MNDSRTVRCRQAVARSLKSPLLTAVTATLGGTMAARLTSVISFFVIARLVAPQELGRFALTMTAGGLITAVQVLGLPSLVTQRIASMTDPTAASRAAGWAFGAFLAWGALTTIAILPVWLLLDGGSTSGTPLIVAVWALGSSTSMLVTSILQGRMAFRLASALAVVRALAVGAMTIVVASTSTAVTLEMAAAGTEFVVAFASSILLIRMGLIRMSRTPPSRRTLVRSLRLVTASGVSSVLLLGSYWLLQRLLTAQENGLVLNAGFAVTQKIILVGLLVPFALAVVTAPSIAARRSLQLGLGQLRRVPLVSMSAALAFAVAVALLATPILHLFGDDYEEFAMTLRIGAFFSIFVALNAAFGNMALGLSMMRPWILSDWVLGVSMATFGLVLVGGAGLGSAGAILAWGGAYMGSVLFLAPVVLWRLKHER